MCAKCVCALDVDVREGRTQEGSNWVSVRDVTSNFTAPANARNRTGALRMQDNALQSIMIRRARNDPQRMYSLAGAIHVVHKQHDS